MLWIDFTGRPSQLPQLAVMPSMTISNGKTPHTSQVDPLFHPNFQLCSSSIFIAFCRLRRMRLNDIDNDPTSSLVLRTYSGVSRFPMLTLFAISEISTTG